MTTATATSKKEVLQNKINSILSNQSGNLSVLNEITRQHEVMNDYIVPMTNVKFGTSDEALQVDLLDNEGNLIQTLGMNDHTINQSALKSGVPGPYMRQLQKTDWGRDLAAQILNEHIDQTKYNKHVMVREIDGVVRGLLSDRYRRQNTEAIYQTFISGAMAAGGQFYRVDQTTANDHLTVILPEVYGVNTENNGVVYSVFGIRLKNSDFGAGAMVVNTFQMNTVCLNGMVTENVLRQVHLGEKMEGNFSQGTYDLYTEAAQSAVQDLLTEALSIETITQQVNHIQAQSAALIEPRKEFLKLPKLGVTKKEIEMIGDKLMASNEAEGVVGKPSKWKMIQAMTAVGNEEGGSSRIRMEEVSGKYSMIV